MELLDVYDDFGEPTGKVVPRGTPNSEFGKGEHIENKKGEYLIERSSKDTGYKYLPVGGHLIAGEKPLDGIIRETKEEIGLDISKEDLHYVGFFNEEGDFPVRFIYYLRKDLDLSELKLQLGEVSDVSYKSVLYLHL